MAWRSWPAEIAQQLSYTEADCRAAIVCWQGRMGSLLEGRPGTTIELKPCVEEGWMGGQTNDDATLIGSTAGYS